MSVTKPLFGDDYASANGLETRLGFWRTFGNQSQALGDWIGTVAELAMPRPAAYLDAGSGTGELLVQVLPHLKSDVAVQAVDFSPAMVTATEKVLADAGARGSVLCADISALPFKDNSFDLITVMHVMHHVPNLVQAISELKRVLRPGGVLLVATASFEPNQGLNALHYAAIEQLELPRFLLETDEYTRFAPQAAQQLLEATFDVEANVFSNDAICDDVDAVSNYYRSAMIFRGSNGPEDPRVTTSQWESLAELVHANVASTIKNEGSFVQPGGVTAFICTNKETV